PGSAGWSAPAPSCARSAAWRRPRASARLHADSTDRHRPWPETSATRPLGRRPARVGAARPPSGRPRRLRCSRSRPARRGDRPHAHIVARRRRTDPLRASFPTPSGPSGPRARTAQCAHRRADRPAAGGGEFQQRWDVGLCETLSWRLLFCEAFASGLVTTRVSRAATEPPLQFSTVTGTSPRRGRPLPPPRTQARTNRERARPPLRTEGTEKAPSPPPRPVSRTPLYRNTPPPPPHSRHTAVAVW